MPQYMMLLYAEDEQAAQEQRWAEMPLWLELTEGLRKAGLLVSNGALHSPDMATTVRVRSGEAEITDGPFAVTKEYLAGYYVLECADLDEALRHAWLCQCQLAPLFSSGWAPPGAVRGR